MTFSFLSLGALLVVLRRSLKKALTEGSAVEGVLDPLH